jgi:hypothetical protein
MSPPRTLTSQDIREIGEALYGAAWQGEMARTLGVPRQSISYYLKSGGVDRTQAAAIIGLIARTAALESRAAKQLQSECDARQAALSGLLFRFEDYLR